MPSATTAAAHKQTGKKRAGPGRPKGSPNKVTASVKAAIEAAFQRIKVGGQKGGVDSLVAWGEKNPDAFYPMWARLVPHEVTGKDGGAIEVSQIWRFGDKTVTF